MDLMSDLMFDEGERVCLKDNPDFKGTIQRPGFLTAKDMEPNAPEGSEEGIEHVLYEISWDTQPETTMQIPSHLPAGKLEAIEQESEPTPA